MFQGEPLKMMVGFMLVQGLEQLYQFVKKNGWNQITEVMEQPWDGKTCSVTTIDGSVLTFFE
jgi:AraC family transcriptional regulator